MHRVVADSGLDEESDQEVGEGIGPLQFMGGLGLKSVTDEASECRAVPEGRRHPRAAAAVAQGEGELVGQNLRVSGIGARSTSTSSGSAPTRSATRIMKGVMRIHPWS